MRANVLLSSVFAMLVSACTSSIDVPESILAFESKLPEKIDYNLHIKPILSDRCFKCHGPDKSKIEAGLQLASHSGATAKLESGNVAIVPGIVGKSELVRRIISTDPESMMPPPESHLMLSDEEKAMLIQWVDNGATYQEHWSLTKIQRPQIPKAGKGFLAKFGLAEDEETQWVRNDIDRFTLHKMKEKGLRPAQEAEKSKLLRRLYMDITGLPPAVEAVKKFLNDKSDGAYEKVVDELLESPHFGEHQATSWLDLARYADSHGYQDDGMRNAYPYRDWVISAFNQNLPFDQFITWQLAGDLLKNPSQDMLIATSFNRQHPQTQEGGVVPEEYQAEYVADRTNTFGKAFLGLTVECARCHDHKYDPISAKDYYSLYAFFNQNKEFGVVPYVGEASPTIMLPEKEASEKIKYIREKLTISSEEIQTQLPTYKEGFKKYLLKVEKDKFDKIALQKELLVHLDFEKQKKNQHINLVANDIHAAFSGDIDRKPLSVPGKFEKGIQLRGDCGIKLLSKVDKEAKKTSDRYYQGLNLERNQPFSLSIWFNILNKGVTGPLITKNNGEFEGYRGYDIEINADGTLTTHMMYVYPANGIEIRTVEKVNAEQWNHIALTYDGSSKASGLKFFLNGKEVKVVVISDNLTKSILHGEKKTNSSFMPLEIGKNFRSTIDRTQVDEFRFYKKRLSTLEIESLYRNDTAVSLVTARDKLYEFYLWNYNPDFAVVQEKLRHLRLEETQVITDVPEVMVMNELPPGQARKTFILTRGGYDAPAEEVWAEIPLKLGGLPEGYPRNRLGLAKWLLHEDNPLFARVMANRFWMQFFGRGLVKTQEDFGNQGDMPTHPELLDWLAIQFREGGWNTKLLVKEIVMSATYRQSSTADQKIIESDPDNQWLARSASYRYTAEQVRDNVLAASGLLVRKIGGPSVYPYQPDGIWEALATRNAVTYKQQHGDSLYRRSMYTIWKLSSPPPMMLTFDAPDRQLCTVRRQRTATPLQALIGLNDPQFVEAARVLSERTLLVHPGMDDRIRHFFISAISREPRQAELDIMKKLLETQMLHYQKMPHEARNLLTVGEYPVERKLDPIEVAAYTVVAHAILNYDEAFEKR